MLRVHTPQCFLTRVNLYELSAFSFPTDSGEVSSTASALQQGKRFDNPTLSVEWHVSGKPGLVSQIEERKWLLHVLSEDRQAPISVVECFVVANGKSVVAQSWFLINPKEKFRKKVLMEYNSQRVKSHLSHVAIFIDVTCFSSQPFTEKTFPRGYNSQFTMAEVGTPLEDEEDELI